MATALKNMKKYIAPTLFIFFAILHIPAAATTRKTAASSTFGLFRYTIELYKENNHGNLPKNWQEMINSDVLTDQMIRDAEIYLDFENRYKFLNPPVVLKNQSSEIKVIVMANRSGGEGDSQSVDEEGNSLEIPGRCLLFETKEGKISSNRFSEKRLEKMFIDAGLNLLDYTFDAPPAPKILSPGNPNSTSGLVLGGPEDSTRSTPPRQEKSRDLAKEWWIWSIALGAASLFGIFLYKKQHSIE